MPDKYYATPLDYVGPDNFSSRCNENCRTGEPSDAPTPRPQFRLWEWCSGTSNLSNQARVHGVEHLPPVDFRYGWPLAPLADEVQQLFSLLFVGVSTRVAVQH